MARLATLPPELLGSVLAYLPIRQSSFVVGALPEHVRDEIHVESLLGHVLSLKYPGFRWGCVSYADARVVDHALGRRRHRGRPLHTVMTRDIAPAVDFLLRKGRVSCQDVYKHAVLLDAIDSLRLIVEKYAFDVKDHDPQALVNACFKTSTRVVAYLVESLGFDPAENNNAPFIAACFFTDYLDTVTYLASLPGVDVGARGNEAFFTAVRWNQLHTAQYLATLPGVDVHANKHDAIREARAYGNLGVLEFLESL